jgi:hypothetical protein
MLRMSPPLVVDLLYREHSARYEGPRIHEEVTGGAPERLDALAAPPAGEEKASKPPRGSSARDR